jgi:hypothetical protein
MKTTRLMGALLIGLIVLAAGPASQALASSPDIIPLHIDYTDVAPLMTDFCGFTIMHHDVANGRLIIRHTQTGDEVDLDIENGTVTFLANGLSLGGIYTGFDRSTYYSDGSFNYLGTGTTKYVVLPGVGPVWGETGSTTFTLDQNGNVISERDFQHNVLLSNAAVCTALEP